MAKQYGNRRLTIRGDRNLHEKIGRIVASTGADRSTVVRAAIGWMSEEQLTTLLSQRGQQQQVANHAL